MSRIRSIKPGFFLDEDLFDLEQETGLPVRVAYAGLWCHADREGRFEWQVRRLKAGILPYDNVDFGRVLDACLTRGLLVKYACQGHVYGWIPTFTKHQVINNREGKSVLPAYDSEDAEIMADLTRAPRVPHACPTDVCENLQEGKGRERKRKGREEEQPPLSPPQPEPPTRKRAAQKSGETFVLPDWVPVPEWGAWVEMRTKKRNAPTEHAKALAVKTLEQLKAQGEDPAAVLNQSTFKGWQGLFSVKENGNGTGGTSTGGNGASSSVVRARPGRAGEPDKYASLYRRDEDV